MVVCGSRAHPSPLRHAFPTIRRKGARDARVGKETMERRIEVQEGRVGRQEGGAKDAAVWRGILGSSARCNGVFRGDVRTHDFRTKEQMDECDRQERRSLRSSGVGLRLLPS